MADVKYQRLPGEEVEDELKNLVPNKRRRNYKCLSFIVALLICLLYVSFSLTCGRCSGYFANLSSEVVNKTSGSTSPVSSEQQVNLTELLVIKWLVFIIGLTMARIWYLATLFCEELHHKQQRHKGSIWGTFKFVFCFGERTIVACLLLFTFFLYQTKCSPIPCSDAVTIIISYLMFFSIFNYQDWHPIEVDIFSKNIHSFGAVFAVGMHGGYTEILANHSKKSIAQRIREYKDEHKETNPAFPEKLFILFPTSCFMRRNLADLDSERIRERQKLREVSIERAGITERVFNNTVYEITDTSTTPKTVYLAVVEYATPLQTLHDFVERGTSTIHLSNDQKREQVLIFYRELRDLLRNDLDTYVLVLVDDQNVQDRKECLLNALIKKIKENLPKKTKEVHVSS